MRVFRVQTGKREWVPPRQEKGLRGVGFSPTGRKLGAVSANGTVLVWDLVTRGHPRPATGLGEARTVVFSPDGERLALVNFNLHLDVPTPTLASKPSP